jgi:alpha-ribazole phosphatase
MKVYLLRHGETEGNIKGAFFGVSETPLSQKGILQAKNAHNKVKDLTFDKVLVSPLSRAQETSRYAGFSQYEVIEDLVEMNFGTFEGLTYKEIEASHKEETALWIKEGYDYVFPNGESLEGFYKRVIGTYKNILKDYRGKNVLIVAHGGVIRSILAHEISENFQHYWKYRVDNCGLSVLAYEDNQIILEKMNV